MATSPGLLDAQRSDPVHELTPLRGTTRASITGPSSPASRAAGNQRDCLHRDDADRAGRVRCETSQTSGKCNEALGPSR